jgi:sugar/nucleoside kinase (ribokinase family)
MKGSATVDLMSPRALEFYGRLCGWTLARAHARSGDPVAIAAYLGTDDAFDRSLTDFSQRYAAQNERDFEGFTGAIDSARIPALAGV